MYLQVTKSIFHRARVVLEKEKKVIHAPKT